MNERTNENKNQWLADGQKKVIKFGSPEYFQAKYAMQKKKAGSHIKPPKPKGELAPGTNKQVSQAKLKLREKQLKELAKRKKAREKQEAKEKLAAEKARKARPKPSGRSKPSVADKYKDATLQQAEAVAKFGKLARHPLAQAELRLRNINAFVATYEASVASSKEDLLAEARLNQAAAEETFRLCVSKGVHKAEAFLLMNKTRDMVRKLEKKLYSNPNPRLEQESPLFKDMLQWQKIEQVRREIVYQNTDRWTRQRVKDLLSKKRPVDDPRACNLLTMVKASAFVDISRLPAAQQYLLSAKLSYMRLSDQIFKCNLDPYDIDEAMKAGRGRTAAKELIHKAGTMGLWLGLWEDFNDMAPRPCFKCGKVMQPHFGRRICDDCHVETRNAHGYFHMIDWTKVPEFQRWPRGMAEEADWQAADKAERRLADMAAGLIKPGEPSPDQKSVRESSWEFGEQHKYLHGWTEDVGGAKHQAEGIAQEQYWRGYTMAGFRNAVEGQMGPEYDKSDDSVE